MSISTTGSTRLVPSLGQLLNKGATCGGKLGESERNARPTEALKPYPGLLIDEPVLFPLPPSASHAPCYQPETCWTTRAWGLVGNVIVSANAGLGPRTGNAAEAIKLAKAGIRHLLEVERSIK